MLTSLKNPKVAAAARLRKRSFREQDRRFLVEGAQGVREGLEAGALDGVFTTDELDTLAVRAGQAGLPVHHVGEDVMRRLTSTVTPQPILGTAPFVDVGLDGLPGTGCVTMLHEVRDPGNAGTVLRSADAAGVGGVVFSETSVDVYNPKTVRASAGSIFHLPVVREVPTPDALAHLRVAGFRILAMDANGAESLYGADLDGPVAFVFGNEAHGLPEEVVAGADATVRVPHAGKAESLNLAAAATVCLFEWARRRSGRGQALETIITAAAHDIRSPLTAMKGFGFTLQTRWAEMTDEQRALMLEGIVFDADRMDFVLRLLVDAARLAAGSLEARRERTDLREIVASIAESQARDPDFPGLEWRGDAGPYFLDPVRLRTALLSFAESLVWWGSEGPVVVESGSVGDHVHVWAWRAGTDLDPDAAEALFLPRRPGTGAGSKIGLYVARGVAQAQGGRAWAEVERGRLAFHLDLPC